MICGKMLLKATDLTLPNKQQVCQEIEQGVSVLVASDTVLHPSIPRHDALKANVAKTNMCHETTL